MMIIITFGLLREPIIIVVFPDPGLVYFISFLPNSMLRMEYAKFSTKTGVFYLYLFASDLLYFLIEILLT